MTGKIRFAGALAVFVIAGLRGVALQAATGAEESVRFHAVFTDHMVLQRDQPVVLKGYAQPGAEVRAELGGAKANTKADARGRWRVSLPAMKAGGPYEAKASAGGKTATLGDVMVGELWLCSGQSNMEMPVWGENPFYRLTNGLEVAAAADDPDLRIAQINRTDGDKGPVEEPGTDPRWWKGWQRANTAEAVKPFSATAYFFGKELRRGLGVPVGIVASSWGGTRIVPWIAGRSKAGEPVRYNGMIAPLEGLQFRGVAWYQGCADQKEWDRYDEWQRKLVASWRENLGRPDLAFICVQLAGLHENRPDKPFTADELAAVGPTEEGFVRIRAEQDRIRRVKGCECVTAFDIGTANDVHAKNKSEVGRRLAAAAANLCYGAKVPVRGPRPLSFVRDGSAILVKFDAPIRLAGGTIGPREFTLKALGGARTWADAVLVAPDTVRVSSPNVENPLRVDYAWVPCVPKASLYNAEGYPVMPFRKYVADPAHYPRARLGKETVLAHRGMSEEAPENTPAAYEKAVGNGFGFECDVYLTKDGRVFSFHDPDLRRIAGIDKACKDCTWDEVKDLDVGKWKGPEWAGQHPSTFEDIMALARDGRWIEVDVKAGPAVVPYLRKLLAAQGNASSRNMFFASSNPKTIRAVREQMPEYGAWLGETCRRGWNAAAPAVPVEKMVEDLRANGANGVCLQFSSDIVTEDYIWALKDAGYPVNVWTVDDPAEARLALERGADTVTSNNPNLLLRATAK